MPGTGTVFVVSSAMRATSGRPHTVNRTSPVDLIQRSGVVTFKLLPRFLPNHVFVCVHHASHVIFITSTGVTTGSVTIQTGNIDL